MSKKTLPQDNRGRSVGSSNSHSRALEGKLNGQDGDPQATEVEVTVATTECFERELGEASTAHCSC